MLQHHVRRALVVAGLVATTGFAHRIAAGRAAEAMAAAAAEFLASLAPDQRARTTFALDADERRRWNFIPNEMFSRKGLWLKDLSPRQRELALAVLRTGLSPRGYSTTTAIMELENVVRAMEQGGRFARHPEEYYLSTFGTPEAKGTWGFRFEGHHVSLHFTVVAGAVTVSTPTFFGSNPAEVREGPRQGTRILATEEDAARALLAALTDAQRGRAIISADAPRDIVTANAHPVSALAPAGLPASEMTDRQRQLLDQLIAAYADHVAEPIVEARWARIKRAGIDAITFAWAGSAERGLPHYYRVQGPTFLIEYDNTQNNANHVHSVWRDFAGDFGLDLLREHLRDSPHHGGGASRR